MNKVMLLGRLGKDAELKYSSEGKPRLSFSVATDYGRGDKKETEWTDCVQFGDSAENLAQYLSKGKQVLVEGRLRTRSWEKDGAKHYRTEVIVGHIEFAGEKPKETRAVEDDALPF
jgi:single-strand DNA-binding protein